MLPTAGDNLIAQNVSRTNIAIADASRRIAFETRRDSDAMKTIAALTMIFLPGTFVAVSTHGIDFFGKLLTHSFYRLFSEWFSLR